jgi:hypothetical protein
VSFISILFGDTGDFLEIADPKTEAGQAAWQRATDESIELSRNPGEMAGEKLLAIVGQRSSLGDPRKPGFLRGLRPGQRAVTLEQLAHVAATAHHLAGRNADGTRNPPIDGVVTMTPQGEAIISRPATKAATAEALRLAADQAGPQRGERLVEAAIAQQVADLAKTAAAARRRTAPAKVATDDLAPTEELYVRDAPEMLFKRVGRAR